MSEPLQHLALHPYKTTGIGNMIAYLIKLYPQHFAALGLLITRPAVSS